MTRGEWDDYLPDFLREIRQRRHTTQTDRHKDSEDREDARRHEP
jgi:hypothetical protein